VGPFLFVRRGRDENQVRQNGMDSRFAQPSGCP
jgi:hypothetical protein